MKVARKKATYTPSIPDDIITEILLKLPAKSLVKLKEVSESWCSLISSKKFVKTQLEHARNTPLGDHNALFISSSLTNRIDIRHCHVSYLFCQQQIRVMRCKFDHHITECTTRIVGCCNGLCCVNVNKKYFVLWNPTTGLSHELPPVSKEYECVAYHGFGYDESNDDYKILVALLVFSDRKHGRGYRYLCRLYSLKTNSWKTVDDIMGGVGDTVRTQRTRNQGILVNGKLHWARGTKTSRFKIVSFDLGSETSGSINGPPSSAHFSLGVIQGCLCVLFDELKTGNTGVWVMAEYGVTDTWCKLMTLPFSNSPRTVISILCKSVEGDFLVELDGSLLTYNPTTEHVRYPEIKRYDNIHDIAVIVPSLVSPFPPGIMDEPEYCAY